MFTFTEIISWEERWRSFPETGIYHLTLIVQLLHHFVCACVLSSIVDNIHWFESSRWVSLGGPYSVWSMWCGVLVLELFSGGFSRLELHLPIYFRVMLNLGLNPDWWLSTWLGGWGEEGICRLLVHLLLPSPLAGSPLLTAPVNSRWAWSNPG